MQEANRLVEAFARSGPRIGYVDVASAMLDAKGEPRHDLYRWDGLHMNPKGYVIWTSILKPVLEHSPTLADVLAPTKGC
jgi:lysophospholipase L1-like esterase